MPTLSVRPLDPSPPRPDHELPPPNHGLTVTVEVDAAHLANPLLAVSRLLASEAKAFANVEGDEERFTVTIAVPDLQPPTLESAESWIRWCVHNAGIRGDLHRCDEAI